MVDFLAPLHTFIGLTDLLNNMTIASPSTLTTCPSTGPPPLQVAVGFLRVGASRAPPAV